MDPAQLALVILAYAAVIWWLLLQTVDLCARRSGCFAQPENTDSNASPFHSPQQGHPGPHVP